MLFKMISFQEILIKHQLKAVHTVNEILANYNTGFSIELLREKQPFSETVNSYIESKALQDLPKRQFTGELTKLDINKNIDLAELRPLLVEIGGFIGFSDDVIELHYQPPDIENVELKLDDEGLRIHSKCELPEYLDFTLMARSNYIISWHSHPRISTPGERDFNSMLKFYDHFKQYFDTPFISALYIPATRQTIYYRITKTEPGQASLSL